MISSKDRSRYIGCSDTQMVIGNWNTKSFEKWWLVKLGVATNNFTNESMKAGTNYEHKILTALNIDDLETDKQIIIGRLRANLDGNTSSKIYEIKTYNYEKGFKVSKAYYNQVQVEMLASNIKAAEIVAYGLLKEDYKNYFNDIDVKRLSHHEIEYDESFINNIYLPRFKYLEHCLINGLFPNEEDYDEWMKCLSK